MLKCLITCWLALVCAGAAAAQADPGGPEAAILRGLQQRARDLHLAEQPMWRKLLHMRPLPLTGRWRSLADDADFFNAPDGAHDAQAELDATLAAFLDAAPRHALQQTAQCRFPARWLWLDAQLDLRTAGVAAQPCERYNAWLQGLDAQRISLIFPAAYINSPASMYGHTFLRVDARGAQGRAHPLLSYAISYAAAGNESEGIAFAFKGLFGRYPGVFTNSPYYLKIREYTHLENRDVWEYELAFTDAEITRLLAHAWELGVTRFDYYFFDENCAYHLLSLIDVARPELDLSAEFTWWAIPVDTVRAVTRTPGLLRGVTYRPSNTTELTVRAAQLSPQAVRTARQLGEGLLTPADLATPAIDTTAEQQGLTLELAERYLGFRTARGDIEPGLAERQRLVLLSERARLPATAPVEVPIPAVAPQDGHGTARSDLLVGRRDGAPFWQLAWRPAYHDLSDPDAGFQRGAQIQFGRLEVARRPDGGLRLERFTPVDIVSLTPSDGLLSGSSWKVRFGLERSYAQPASASPSASATEAPLAVVVNGCPGRSWAFAGGGSWLPYAFIDNQFGHDPALPARRWMLGSGLALGLLWDPAPAWRLQLEAWQRFYVGLAASEQGGVLHLRRTLNHDLNAVLECRHEQRGQASRRNCAAGLQRYW